MEAAWWLAALSSDPAVRQLAGEIEAGGEVSVRGAAGSSTSILVGALAGMSTSPGPYLLVVPHIDEADEAVEELRNLGIEADAFPALEVMPGETNPSIDLVAARLERVRDLLGGASTTVIVAPFPALMQGVPGADRIDELQRLIRPGEVINVDDLLTWLAEAGWERVDAVENPGEFTVRGGVIDLFPPGGGVPVRLDLFGDEVEGICEIDPATQASDRALDVAVLIGSTSSLLDDDSVPLASLLPAGSTVVLAELAEIVEQGRGYWERVRDSKGVQGPPAALQTLREQCRCLVDVNAFSASNAAGRVVEIAPAALPPFDEEVARALEEVRDIARLRPVAVACTTAGEFERARELFGQADSDIRVEHRHVHRGFIFDGEEAGFAVVPFHEVLNRWGIRRRTARLRSGSTRDEFLRFEAGDLVVHREHGIARFLGLGTLPRDDGRGDDEVLTLEFHGGSRLHVPLNRIELVQRYVGAGGGKVTLSTLGGKRWKRQKESVEGAVKDLAGELLRVQAARSSTPGIHFPGDTDWQREFEAEFPYEETEDQVTAISAMKRDMSESVPMDRLICGDVGFGKTEVAIRGAFKVAEHGKQVAVLVPTTVLAEQHERTFRSRFRAYPFRIESLSRFKTGAEIAEVLEELAAGRVDVVIGTHRLLSKDVRFNDLGLVVIDEEQRFGVEHKQRLLEFRTTADVLTLSATPIPRTLHMSMLGLRDISSLATAPLDRRAIVTEVIPYNELRIKRAITRELAREGQVFFVHNRVYDIESVADDIHKIAPDARIIIGHGQMSGRTLEKVMLSFVRRQIDVLVCTTIIESGIDIPTANTIIINQ
ncbi:MAG: DEAD/DEAH box helicase, partial [Phycisphaerales bacterium]|nr:DEAD/DEAH box helicase [Phycisphaerales bacterium]